MYTHKDCVYSFDFQSLGVDFDRPNATNPLLVNTDPIITINRGDKMQWTYIWNNPSNRTVFWESATEDEMSISYPRYTNSSTGGTTIFPESNIENFLLMKEADRSLSPGRAAFTAGILVPKIKNVLTLGAEQVAPNARAFDENCYVPGQKWHSYSVYDPEDGCGEQVKNLARLDLVTKSGICVPTEIVTHEDRIYISNEDGIINIIRKNTGVRLGSLLDLRGKVKSLTSQGGGGLLSFAFDPFKNGSFYVMYRQPSADNPGLDWLVFTNTSNGNPGTPGSLDFANHFIIISRFDTDSDYTLEALLSTEHVLFNITREIAFHNGGRLLFGPDGYLYITLGDGDEQKSPHAFSQQLNTTNGALLKVDLHPPATLPYDYQGRYEGFLLGGPDPNPLPDFFQNFVTRLPGLNITYTPNTFLPFKMDVTGRRERTHIVVNFQIPSTPEVIELPMVFTADLNLQAMTYNLNPSDNSSTFSFFPVNFDGAPIHPIHRHHGAYRVDGLDVTFSQGGIASVVLVLAFLEYDVGFEPILLPATIVPIVSAFVNAVPLIRTIDYSGYYQDLPYLPAPDNPFFCDGTGADSTGPDIRLAEINAYGFRNPWKFSFDERFIQPVIRLADVGQNHWEELNTIEPTYGKFERNFGWPITEGPMCHQPNDGDKCDTEGMVEPEASYPHSPFGDVWGISVTGGYHYRGPSVAQWARNLYMFMDWFTGTLFYWDKFRSGTTIVPMEIVNNEIVAEEHGTAPPHLVNVMGQDEDTKDIYIGYTDFAALAGVKGKDEITGGCGDSIFKLTPINSPITCFIDMFDEISDLETFTYVPAEIRIHPGDNVVFRSQSNLLSGLNAWEGTPGGPSPVWQAPSDGSSLTCGETSSKLFTEDDLGTNNYYSSLYGANMTGVIEVVENTGLIDRFNCLGVPAFDLLCETPIVEVIQCVQTSDCPVPPLGSGFVTSCNTVTQTCEFTETLCGNGVVDDGEECDGVSGCSSECKANSGFICTPSTNKCTSSGLTILTVGFLLFLLVLILGGCLLVNLFLSPRRRRGGKETAHSYRGEERKRR